MPIVWRETMSSGHPEIDADHEELVAMVNGFEQAIAAEHGEEALTTLLFRLQNKAKGHFAREEAIQRARRFPLSHPHRREHEDLLAQLAGILDRHAVARTSPLDQAGAQEIFEFLRAWLVDHIVMDDLRLKPFVEEP